MQMSIQFIPSEILIQIFQLLHRNDVYSSLFVCKRWYLTAVKLYYQLIVFNEEHIKYDQYFKFGHLAEKLKSTHLQYTKLLERQEFLLILSYVPNLKTLDLTCNNKYAAYMDMLCYDTNTSIYLQHIEEISGYCDGLLNRDLHFLACYNFRKTIKRLDVFAGDYSINDRNNSTLYYLPHFTGLTYLNICNLMERDLTLFDVLLCCENLSELVYTSSYPVPLRAKDQVGTTNNKYLKRLTLDLSLDATPYLDYVCSLHHLDSLTLNIIPENVYDWFQTFETFAEDLRKFKNLRITSNGTPTPNVSASQMKVFYSFLLKLKGDTNLQFKATFFNKEYFITHPLIDISNHKLNFAYYMKDEDPSPFLDKQGIVKTLLFKLFVYGVPSNLLEYAATCTRLETLCVDSMFIFLEHKDKNLHRQN